MKFDYVSRKLNISIVGLLCGKAATIEEVVTLEKLEDNEKAKLFEMVYDHLEEQLGIC